ncbi:type II toxin-antitoxin system RelE/ParE family toxin [Pusillimonas sp. CC-YST705]|uniref:Type II toxin-antitoxin system RelE/ParE family toxin n=1 Tax=Mesopusillimonas faecipullorum TaxID=2755040 RepID=A0ABS8CA51_9BURK|nr:type II toxin-antitoxin system RelE/ParE family toxin [Mesopusillimonas faecipullorum]MCB5362900.1 type II toxin-antitoxin system RelE/ParE family toxin [Mesopusillimonas faecipullorum]
MYAVNWSNKAKKQLRKIDRKEQITIVNAVDGLESFPDTKNVIALTNHEYGYRMRVGNYRVLFDADTEVRIIEIQQVKKRDDQTY